MRGGRSAGPLLLAAVLAAPAAAQVTVNPGALDLLPGPPRAATASPHPIPRPVPARPPRAVAPGPGPVAPPAPPQAAAAPRPPVMPTVPPAIAALPPPPPVPSPRVIPNPVPPVAADAPGTAVPEPNGLRVTFGPGGQELNAATDAALRSLARSLRATGTSVTVLAYASGTPDDPSTPRRISLARALNARAVLINEGIASSRIYPRALGTAGGDTDPDRIDVTTGPPATPSPAAAPPAPPPPAAR